MTNPIPTNTPQTITASIEQIQALLQLVQRAPTSTAERLFVEMLFTQWFSEINASAGASAGDVSSGPPNI